MKYILASCIVGLEVIAGQDEGYQMNTKFSKMNLDMIVYEEIRDGLIRGEYVPGQRISVDDIAERYGVSRTPTLQALKLLINDNVLDLLGNGKIIVPTYSAKQANDIINARLVFEKYAVEQCCMAKNSNVVKMLRKTAESCQSYLEQGDVFHSHKEDLNLHRQLVESADNDCITDVYVKVQGRYLIANFMTQEYRTRTQGQAAADHNAFLDYLDNWDAENAWRVMEKHISNTREQIIKALELHNYKIEIGETCNQEIATE